MGSRKKKFTNKKTLQKCFGDFYKPLSLEERIAVKAFYFYYGRMRFSLKDLWRHPLPYQCTALTFKTLIRENNDRLDILDGQHRFYICKKLKRPVYYILVTEEKSMPDIAKVNSNVEKWKPSDFVNCYIQHGNRNYETIRYFTETYGISLSVVLKMLHCGNPGNEGANTDLTELFRTGQFVVNNLEEAEHLVNDCQLFNFFENWRSRAFVIAIHRIKKAGLVELHELVTTCCKRPEMLTQQANYKAYVNTLEQILNVGKQKRIVII